MMGLKIIDELKKMIDTESRKLQNIKMEYVLEMQSKNEAENIIRQCIEDIREELMKANQTGNQANKSALGAGNNHRLEQILNDERTLTMIYDRAFYSNMKNMLPPGTGNMQRL